MKRIPFVSLLFFFFTVFALIELLLIIFIASQTGFLFTLALIILTGLVGAVLVRAQGVVVFSKAMRQVSAGQLPAQPLLEGVLILIGGVLLIAPGFITDCIGISIMIPGCRNWYVKRLRQYAARRFRIVDLAFRRAPSSRPPGNNDVIDVDYRKEDKKSL